jgi:hypothetical protein
LLQFGAVRIKKGFGKTRCIRAGIEVEGQSFAFIAEKNDRTKFLHKQIFLKQ